MRRSAAGLVLALGLVGQADAKPGVGHAPSHGPVPLAMPRVARAAPPLPMLPSLARVRIEAARDRVIVVEEVNLPRGDWHGGGLDLYVAFGAPGTPLAVDARLAPIPARALEARPDDAGDPVGVEAAVRHTPSSQLLLGRPTMAGVVVHVREAQLRSALVLGDAAALRIRSLLAPPAADASGARDVVVRLGSVAGQPLTLAKVQLVSLEPAPWVTRAEAKLCGPEADSWPLSLALLPKPVDAASAAGTTTVIAPPLAVRHASDDLCVRWWSRDKG
jgi:hypothetical protein